MQYIDRQTDIANKLTFARSKAWVYGRSLVGIAGSNPAVSMDFCPL